MKRSECYQVAMLAVLGAEGYTDEARLEVLELLMAEKRYALMLEDQGKMTLLSEESGSKAPTGETEVK